MTLTLDDYRNRVIDVLRGLHASGIGPVVLVGHSLGGLALSAVGEAVPELVRRLVYVTAMVVAIRANLSAYLALPSFSTAKTLGLLVADPASVGAFRINFASTDVAYQAGVKDAFCADVDAATFVAMSRMLAPDEPAGGAGPDDFRGRWLRTGSGVQDPHVGGQPLAVGFGATATGRRHRR